MNLVIVESPSKAKTIEKYLGKDFIVDASGGHVRDLPVKTLGIDVKNNFQPDYQINADKKAVIKRLMQKSAKADKIYLATDPDREGEAISWHLAYALKLPLEESNRIVFNEISQKAVKKALEQPRQINIDLVNAQQARRVLDRLVGYKISPLLCKKIQNNLSAGRVQSAALRIIIERENEINAFIPKEYWNITAMLVEKDNANNEKIVFKASLALKNNKKFKPSNAEESNNVVESVKNAEWKVKSVKRAVSKSTALPPFTTSTLQQDASNKLSMPSSLTMSTAQNLYEGVSIEGEGQIALVTYIRTDSVRISADAQKEALEYIEKNFGKEYVPEKPNLYKSKKAAQDAHEAIRPISLERTPDSLKNKLQRNHYKLYKLIYDRFLASQMAPALYNTLNVDIEADEYTFRSTGKTLVFKGYTLAYDDYKEPSSGGGADDEEDSVDSGKIPPLKDGDLLKLEDIKQEQKFTKPPLRFSDASLVKALEEKGIGRPSTYASILSVILKREYVIKEAKYLKPTELGYAVNEMLVKHFDRIVDVSFTASMEEQLDGIEEGGKQWQDIISTFYEWLEKKIKIAKDQEVEVSEEKCEACGVNMIVKVGKYGKFLGCPNYPKCKVIKPLAGVSNSAAAAPEEETNEVCEKCGNKMLLRTGKYGKYLACSNYPDCKNIKSENEEKSEVLCEKCNNNMVIRSGRYGKYLNCPECKINKPIAESVGACPKCGKDVYKRMSKSGKVFYGCSGYPSCDFISWDIPTKEKCPKCSELLGLRKLKNGDKYVCANKNCRYESDLFKIETEEETKSEE